MRQRVTLYIDGQKADLTDESLILFTYSAEDADNPSIVVNSYTKTLTLAGTKQNSIIFDHIEAKHHRVASRFSPLVRTPFVIYAETGEVLETGYLKLDSITEENKGHAYNVTLYGGLGGLLYSLMYNSDGSDRTLADMDYDAGCGVTDAELQFRISATEVYNAWQYLCRAVASDDRWKLVNFAPMYNGLPENFDANKCVVPTSAVKGYAPIDGYAAAGGCLLTTFSEAVDEWRIRDLRSYLQRPVLNVNKVLDTVVAEATSAGYTLSIDAKLTSLMTDVWMTLPRLSSLIKADGTGGRDTLTVATYTLNNTITTGNYPVVTPSHGNATWEDTVAVEIGIKLEPVSSFTSGATYMLNDGIGTPANVVYLLQLVAYDGTGAIAASEIVSLSSSSMLTGNAISAIGGNLYSEFVDAEAKAGHNYQAKFYATSASSATMQDAGGTTLLVPLSLTAYNATQFKVIVQRRDLQGAQHDCVFNGGTSYDTMAHLDTTGNDDYTSAGLMTGAYIDKDVLLGGTMSPASFLIGLCRIYGFKMHYDPITKTLSVLSRGDYYNGGTVNIDGRIDHAQAQSTVPYVFTHRFYRWALEGLGAYAAEYAKTWGQPYGGMTADTGFPFDNDTEDVLAGVPFKTAADVLHRDAAFLMLSYSGGNSVPSPFLYGGAKYKMWNGDDSKDFDAPTVGSDYTLTYVNRPWSCYDRYPKIEMQADGKGVDGFVLVKYGGRAADEAYGAHTTNVILTDDTPQMLSMNNGKACWRFTGDGGGRVYTVSDATTYETGTAPLPLFNRITGAWSSGTWVATETLEIAVPSEIDIPDVDVSAVTSVYAAWWQAFAADRYDVDARVLTARVFWRGFRVTGDLLRAFYTFGGAVWCLTAIKDYALTSEQPTECVFVKVKDTANYEDGAAPTPPTPPTPPEPPTPQRVDLEVGTWTSSFYIQSRTGAETSTNATWSATNKIALGEHAPGNTLNFCRVERSSSSYRTGMAFYKGDGTFLSGQDPFVGSGNMMIDGTVEIPENAAFVAFSCYTNKKASFYAWYEYTPE